MSKRYAEVLDNIESAHLFRTLHFGRLFNIGGCEFPCITATNSRIDKMYKVLFIGSNLGLNYSILLSFNPSTIQSFTPSFHGHIPNLGTPRFTIRPFNPKHHDIFPGIFVLMDWVLFFRSCPISKVPFPRINFPFRLICESY